MQILSLWRQASVPVGNISKLPGFSRNLFPVILLFLSACTVGPNYHSPQTKVPDTFANQTGVNAPAPNLAQWWTTLQDPVLDSLIDRAVRGNPDLRLAQARVREARAQYGIAKSDLLPNVNASASYQRIRTSENSVPSGDGTTFPNFEGDLYQAGFDASWEIDVFGGIRRSMEAANADIAAEIENRRQVLVTMLAEVSRNYVELRTSQRRVAIARANLSAQKETLELTQIRFNAGLTSDLDVARAEAQVQNTASQIPLLEASARQSMHLLAVLLGLDPGALISELSGESPIPSAPDEVPSGLPSDLLRRRPDIRQAERQLAGATARIGVATADLFPRFSLTGAFGLLAGNIGRITDSGSQFWSIVPGVSFPIFNYGKIRNNIAVQNAREEQAFVNYERTILNSMREVEDALISFSENQKRRQILTGSVASNRRAVDLANELYSNGLTDFLTVLQAQRDLFEAEDSLAQSDSTVSTDFISLYKALGGGWEIEAAATDSAPKGKSGERALEISSAKSSE